MSLCTSNLHPSSSSINLFSNNNNSPKPSLSSLRFSTSTSPSSSVAPLSFSTTNHALSSPFPSNHIQSRQLWIRCITSESEPSISVAPGGNGGTVTAEESDSSCNRYRRERTRPLSRLETLSFLKLNAMRAWKPRHHELRRRYLRT
ncbi:unnamed protein product [Brassica oleracea]